MSVAVIFEAWPAEGRLADYLDFAMRLRRELEATDGFLSIERFQSLSEPGTVLSLSFWRDEAAVARWRALPSHRAVQAEGRAGVFRDYRLRVAAVVRDYGLRDRAEAPADSRAHHDVQHAAPHDAHHDAAAARCPHAVTSAARSAPRG